MKLEKSLTFTHPYVRKRDTHRERDRQRERDTHRQGERDRERLTETEIYKDKGCIRILSNKYYCAVSTT